MAMSVTFIVGPVVLHDSMIVWLGQRGHRVRATVSMTVTLGVPVMTQE